MRKSEIFIIAEVSANHGQSFDRAVRMIRAAKACGADAIKFQAYTPDTITMNCKNKFFLIDHSKWGKQSLYELYQKAYTPWEWFPKLKHVADQEGIAFFATAFDKTSIDMLESIKVSIHKIASFELVDIPLIEYAASTKKPLLMSTGMATQAEIKEAVAAARKAGAESVALLKCVSAYPAKKEEMNLLTITDMKKRFRCEVGLSDHSIGIDASVCAAGLGASMIEKHFILSKKSRALDAFFSITPKELKELVRTVRDFEGMRGAVQYGPTRDEKKSLVFRRSLFAVEDIQKGERFTEDNIRSIRPGYGKSPKHLKKMLGAKSPKAFKKGHPLT